MGQASNPKPRDKFFTTGQVAEQCGVNFRTVIRWIQKGYLKAYRLPGSRADHRIPAEEFERFLATHQNASVLEERAPIKILIVDDDPQACKLLQRVLTKNGYHTLVASDGFTAGMMIRDHKPQLVTLDLKMKGLNGFQVLKGIRESVETRNTYVLVISGDAPIKLNEAIRMGADAALGKPFRNQELLNLVESLVSNQRVSSAS